MEMLFEDFMTRQWTDNDIHELKSSIHHMEHQMAIMKQNVCDLSCQFDTFKSTMLDQMQALCAEIKDLHQ